MIFVHHYKVTSLVSLENPAGLKTRLPVFNKQVLLSTISFSTNSYLFLNFRPSLLWIIFALLGLLILVKHKKNKYPVLIALFSFLPTLLIIGFIGQTPNQDYWGPIYIPLTAMFSTTILNIFK